MVRLGKNHLSLNGWKEGQMENQLIRLANQLYEEDNLYLTAFLLTNKYLRPTEYPPCQGPTAGETEKLIK